MEELITYLFKKHITNDSSELISALLKLAPIVLSSSLKLTPEDLQLLQYLIAKSIVTYSPSQLTVSLNKKMVLVYQRLYKLKRFAMKHYNPQFSHLVEKIISNEFLPVTTTEKTLNMLLQPTHIDRSQSKSKKKKEDHHEEPSKNIHLHGVDYSRLLFQYTSKTGNQHNSETEVMVSIDQLTEQLMFFILEKWFGKDRGDDLKKQLKSDQKRELYLQMYDASKQHTGVRVQLIKQTISKVKQEKIEEYILQTFRKYDGQDTINERLSSNCLLTFNCVKRFPLTGEKQLIGLTFLPLVLQRKCLNLLVQEGFLHFYPQGPRSLVYRIREYEQIQQLFLGRLCSSLLNLHLLSQSPLQKEQLLKLECMIADLDDILLLF